MGADLAKEKGSDKKKRGKKRERKKKRMVDASCARRVGAAIC